MRSSRTILLISLLILCSVNVLGTTYLYDDFNRANSSTIGNALTGQTWGQGSATLNNFTVFISGVGVLNNTHYSNPSEIIIWSFSTKIVNTATQRDFEMMTKTGASSFIRNIDLRTDSGGSGNWAYVKDSDCVAGGGVTQVVTGTAVSAGTTQEHKVFVNQQTQTFDWYVDGTLLASSCYRDLTPPNNINFTAFTSSGAGSTFIDNVNVSDNASNNFKLFRINTFDENTGNILYGSLITLNVVGSSNNTNTFQYNGTGQIGLNLTNDLLYTFTLSKSNYATRSYEINISNYIINNSYYEGLDINTYLTAFNESTVFTTIDADNPNIIIPNALINIFTFVNNTNQLVFSKRTDITGRLTFSYTTNKAYSFAVTASGYENKNFELNPIIYTSYDIPLRRGTSNRYNTGDFTGVSITISPPSYYNGSVNNISYIILSPLQQLTFYSWNATYSRTNLSVFGSGSNASGQAFASTLNITNAIFGDKVYFRYTYNLSDGSQRDYLIVYDIVVGRIGSWEANRIAIQSSSLFDRVLMVTIIIGFITALAFFVGGLGAAAYTAVLLFGLFIALSFLPVWAAVISIILLLIILMKVL